MGFWVQVLEFGVWDFEFEILGFKFQVWSLEVGIFEFGILVLVI